MLTQTETWLSSRSSHRQFTWGHAFLNVWYPSIFLLGDHNTSSKSQWLETSKLQTCCQQRYMQRLSVWTLMPGCHTWRGLTASSHSLFLAFLLKCIMSWMTSLTLSLGRSRFQCPDPSSLLLESSSHRTDFVSQSLIRLGLLRFCFQIDCLSLFTLPT